MNLMARGMAAHIRRKKQTDGRTVTYSRGREAITLIVWPDAAESRRLTLDPVDTAVNVSDRTYVFAAADLVMGGTTVLPEKDDRITETINGEELAFELRVTPDNPGWNHFDNTRTMLIVRMKRVKPK